MSAIQQESPSAQKFTEHELSLIGDIQVPMRVLKTTEPADSLFLRKTALEVSPGDISTTAMENLVRRMYLTVTDPNETGVGIAAPQVGISRRVILVQRFDMLGDPFQVFINPSITRYGQQKEAGAEGCLSVPDVSGMVERSTDIDVCYYMGNGEYTQETIQGFTAVIFQHEMDHLQGIIFTDRVLPGEHADEISRTKTELQAQ